MEVDYARKGVAGAGLGLGIAGTALGLLNGGGGILNLGGWGNNCGCSESMLVNRYEANQAARIQAAGRQHLHHGRDGQAAGLYGKPSARHRGPDLSAERDQCADHREHRLHAGPDRHADGSDQDRNPHHQRVPRTHARIQQLDGTHRYHLNLLQKGRATAPLNLYEEDGHGRDQQN